MSTFINTSTSDEIKFLIQRHETEITLMVKPEMTYGNDSLGNKVKKRMKNAVKNSPINEQASAELGSALKQINRAQKNIKH